MANCQMPTTVQDHRRSHVGRSRLLRRRGAALRAGVPRCGTYACSSGISAGWPVTRACRSRCRDAAAPSTTCTTRAAWPRRWAFRITWSIRKSASSTMWCGPFVDGVSLRTHADSVQPVQQPSQVRSVADSPRGRLAPSCWRRDITRATSSTSAAAAGS